ncbi:hypothetical protein JD844_023904 [Phrynosoma platyrhinos]|uniref:GST N-terminal domain-containing protein n=1 Tax=Phrynosoma platyrhinos TaxID=52577 RepID=A0ABQ7SY13_PHRPL|nr:hypothetical protein JD844_023904 [Phrynosoma platyrhinos]
MLKKLAMKPPLVCCAAEERSRLAFCQNWTFDNTVLFYHKATPPILTEEMMSGKPSLHYIPGRGRTESIRWLLAAAGVAVCVSTKKRRDSAE